MITSIVIVEIAMATYHNLDLNCNRILYIFRATQEYRFTLSISSFSDENIDTIPVTQRVESTAFLMRQ